MYAYKLKTQTKQNRKKSLTRLFEISNKLLENLRVVVCEEANLLT